MFHAVLSQSQLNAYTTNAQRYGILRVTQVLKAKGIHNVCIGWVIARYRARVGV